MHVCLSARQEDQAPCFATQGIESPDDCVMHSSVLHRWVMHTAWTTLREITVWGDKGKAVVKSANFPKQMQPCWSHIKTNLPLFCHVPVGALLHSKKGNETVRFCALFQCTTGCHAVFCLLLAALTDLGMQVNR